MIIKEVSGAVVFDVQVVPKSSREKVGPIVGDRLKVQLTAPPVDGAANQALIELIARRLGVAKRNVAIVRGETGRKKTLRIDGVSRAEVESALEVAS